MTRHDKIVDAVFGRDKTSNLPEWKQIQESEQKRRDTLRDKQKSDRLAREAAAASEESAKPAKAAPRRRTKA